MSVTLYFIVKFSSLDKYISRSIVDLRSWKSARGSLIDGKRITPWSGGVSRKITKPAITGVIDRSLSFTINRASPSESKGRRMFNAVDPDAKK